MHQDALLESAPVLSSRPHRDTGGGKTLAKPFARATHTPTRHAILLRRRQSQAEASAKMEAARRARHQDGIVYAGLIIVTISILALSILLFDFQRH
jgi:hypothetical protein